MGQLILALVYMKGGKMFVSVIMVLSQVDDTIFVGVKSNWGTSDADKKVDTFVLPLDKHPLTRRVKNLHKRDVTVEELFVYALLRVGHHAMAEIPGVVGREPGQVFNAHIVWADGTEAIPKASISQLITNCGYVVDPRFHQPRTVSEEMRKSLCGVKQEP
jgi:hypothetical protein